MTFSELHERTKEWAQHPAITKLDKVLGPFRYSIRNSMIIFRLFDTANIGRFSEFHFHERSPGLINSIVINNAFSDELRYSIRIRDNVLPSNFLSMFTGPVVFTRRDGAIDYVYTPMFVNSEDFTLWNMLCQSFIQDRSSCMMSCGSPPVSVILDLFSFEGLNSD